MDKSKEFLGFSRSMLLQCILLFIGILGGLLVSNYVFLIVAGATILVSLFCNFDYTYYHLFFTLPFTVIFKLSPTSTSIFTYVMIITGLVLLLRRRKYYSVPTIMAMLFIIYSIVGMGGNYTSVGKLVAGLFLLYIFVTTVSPANYKNHIIAYALGILGSSIIGTMKETWGRLSPYFSNLDYVYYSKERIARFSGLNYDPNYYSIGVIIVIFFLLRLLFNKQGNRLFTLGLTVALVIFGFISYSKMFLLSIAILAVCFIFYRMKNPKQLIMTLLSAIIAVMLFVFWARQTGYLDIIIGRMSGDISTGRFDIWERCFSYIGSSPKTLLFGDGLGYQRFEPHNAYIELILIFGVLGGALLLLTICNIISLVRYVNKRNFIHYALILIFLIMIATLGIVTVNDLMFYCIFLFISMNLDTPEQARSVLN